MHIPGTLIDLHRIAWKCVIKFSITRINLAPKATRSRYFEYSCTYGCRYIVLYTLGKYRLGTIIRYGRTAVYIGGIRSYPTSVPANGHDSTVKSRRQVRRRRNHGFLRRTKNTAIFSTPQPYVASVSRRISLSPQWIAAVNQTKRRYGLTAQGARCCRS